MNADDNTSLGGQLRQHRLAARLSQERLARAADCSTSTIRLAERGWIPSPDMQARLAAALECPVSDVFPIDDESPADEPGSRKIAVAAATDARSG